MPAHRFTFGAFELEPANFQLSRSGLAIEIERIPMELLLILVERGGQLVNRSEIVERIWGKDVYLDTESAVNTAVRKLRHVLGDDPKHPLYIETVPAKGYRLIAPLETSAAAPQTRLAVLPLECLSDDPVQGYLSDGMTEEIIAQMGCLHPHLGVIARTSAMGYKNTSKSIREIGRELNVQYILEGSMRCQSGRVRVTAHLIESTTQSHLWAEAYERPLEDVLDLQRRLAQQIAGQIRAELKVSPNASALPPPAVRPEAYLAYTKGRFFWNKKTGDGVIKSLEYFQEAVRLEPTFAPGYAGLADAYIFLGILGFRPPAEVYPRAEEAALAALALDPNLAEARTSLADVRKGYHWDWPGAEAEFRRAIELNPSYALARHWYSEHLSAMGRADESIQQIEVARQLDPLSVPINAFVGYTYYRARRYARAETELARAIELDPHLPLGHWFLGLVSVQRGELDRAVRELTAAVELSEGAPVYLAALGFGLGVSGGSEKAREVLARLNRMRETRYVSPLDLAVVHTGLGDNDAAFEWLETAYRERVMRIRELREPLFDRLRPDPRFADIMSRIGLPDHGRLPEPEAGFLSGW
jgi:TolB-like protein/Flp pilus assembly protein TadD